MQEVNGSIAILGSGETSPNLVSVHRNLINKIDGEVIASLIDTPFGFQENADQLVDKLIEFYDVSLNLEINLASFRNKKYFKSVEYFEFIKKIQSSNFIFSGPGSPSYATKNWIDTDVPEIFKERLCSGSSLIFASAAASTLGIRTIPVYEIYKVGIDPYWEKGINLLEVFDIDCVVVPHFNNKEGGNHDTSISYLGAKRMEILQEIQPTNILGIDEHTALIIDAKENLFEVEGLGQVTVINQNETQNFKNGEKYNLDDLRKLLEKHGKDTDETWSTITTNQGSVSHLDFLTQEEKDVFKTAFELDQRWLVDLSADRTPHISQAQSINLFLPADVHKRDLHQIHFQAWKKGLKSLYYCRSKSIQRAENVNDAKSTDITANVYKSKQQENDENKYEECLSCQ